MITGEIKQGSSSLQIADISMIVLELITWLVRMLVYLISSYFFHRVFSRAPGHYTKDCISYRLIDTGNRLTCDRGKRGWRAG